jgi:cobalt-zinc-cadmium efflux system protein
MIVFAIVGTAVNVAAAIITNKGNSLNQKAVNLHMLEDALGWIGVLVGAVIMKFTNLLIIDPLLSIGIAIWIFINASKTLLAAVRLIADKSPIDPQSIIDAIKEIDGIVDVHHVHIWSADTQTNYATMHILTTSNHREIKKKIREKLKDFSITHSTLELESKWEHCDDKFCGVEVNTEIGCACHKH